MFNVVCDKLRHEFPILLEEPGKGSSRHMMYAYRGYLHGGKQNKKEKKIGQVVVIRRDKLCDPGRESAKGSRFKPLDWK